MGAGIRERGDEPVGEFSKEAQLLVLETQKTGQDQPRTHQPLTGSVEAAQMSRTHEAPRGAGASKDNSFPLVKNRNLPSMRPSCLQTPGLCTVQGPRVSPGELATY